MYVLAPSPFCATTAAILGSILHLTYALNSCDWFYIEISLRKLKTSKPLDQLLFFWNVVQNNMALPIHCLEGTIRHRCHGNNNEIPKLNDVLIGCRAASNKPIKILFRNALVNFNMADSTRPTSNELDHPEVLSKERLLEILRERSMHPQGLADLDKGDLVQLFYKYVTPLPQRLHQLRRAKRGTPCGRESGTSKTKTSTIIRLTKR